MNFSCSLLNSDIMLVLSTDCLRAFVADPIFDSTDEIPKPGSTLSFPKLFSSSSRFFCSGFSSSPVVPKSNRVIDVVADATPVNSWTLALSQLPTWSGRTKIRGKVVIRSRLKSKRGQIVIAFVNCTGRVLPSFHQKCFNAHQTILCWVPKTLNPH